MTKLLFMLTAVALFLIAAFIVTPTRFNLTALGLAFFAAAHLDLPLP